MYSPLINVSILCGNNRYLQCYKINEDVFFYILRIGLGDSTIPSSRGYFPNLKVKPVSCASATFRNEIFHVNMSSHANSAIM